MQKALFDVCILFCQYGSMKAKPCQERNKFTGNCLKLNLSTFALQFSLNLVPLCLLIEIFILKKQGSHFEWLYEMSSDCFVIFMFFTSIFCYVWAPHEREWLCTVSACGSALGPPLNNSHLDKYWMLLFEAHINQYFEVACLSFHGQGGKRTSLGACRCLVFTCS